MLVGDSSQSQMDYSSQVVDPKQAHTYAGYAGGFEGYDRMKEEAMFYQPQEEANDEEVAHDEDVPEDVEADYLEAYNIVPEREPEPETETRRRCCAPLIPPCPVVGPPFPRAPETTVLLSDYARHVVIPL